MALRVDGWLLKLILRSREGMLVDSSGACQGRNREVPCTAGELVSDMSKLVSDMSKLESDMSNQAFLNS